MNFPLPTIYSNHCTAANHLASSGAAVSAIKSELIGQLRHLFSSPLPPKSIFRLEIPIADCSPLEWLSWQNHATQIYWSGRHSDFEVAGIGCADKVQSYVRDGYEFALRDLERNLKNYPNVRYYGGIKFNPRTKAEEHWLSYGTCFFILPQFEIFSNVTGTYFVCNVAVKSGQSAQEKLQSIIHELDKVVLEKAEAARKQAAVLLSRQDIPDRKKWLNNIDSALDILNQGKCDKIVIGRSTILSFDAAPDSIALLKKLKEIEPCAYHFCIRPATGWTFIGATPERLYKRQQGLIQSEAVAGTCPRGTTPAEDAVMAQALLSSEKEYREHICVRDNIQAVLAAYCHPLEVGAERGLLKQSKVQHLYSQISGRLVESVSNIELLKLLHPTPAVAGLPRENVLREIAKLEAFDRGWFAGPIGWLGGDEAEFAVGIRSGMVNGKEVRLFAGAGIVQGSIPAREWDEVESKISVFLEALDTLHG